MTRRIPAARPSTLMNRPPASFVEYVGLTSQHAAAARRQAERDESMGAWDAAHHNWTLALTIEPDVSSAWQGLARCLRVLGRAHEARHVEELHHLTGTEVPS